MRTRMQEGFPIVRSRAVFAMLAVIVAAGLALRIAAGRGGIWLDEAWSAVMAREAGNLAGVFLRINHDNNHHLNTAWLQLVGIGAPPLAMRALSIATGTLSILVAALIGARHGRGAALATAALFALSPFMMLYGSEARGYAPATLAILTIVLFSAKGMAGDARARPILAVATGLGMIAHLVVLPALLLIAAASAIGTDGRWRDGLRAAAPVFDLALITAFTLAIIIIGGAQTLGGLAIGGHVPFSAALVGSGLAELVSLTTGALDVSRPGLAAAALLVAASALLCAIPPRPARADAMMWFVLGSGMIGAVLLTQSGNSGFARYYLCTSVALLLLLGNRIGALIDAVGTRRLAGWTLLAALAASMLASDRKLIAAARGAPDQAIAVIKTAMPGGATLFIDYDRTRATVQVAAAQARYPMKIAGPECGEPADFLLIAHFALKVPKPEVNRCGSDWALIASRPSIGPSGEPWALYVARR